MQDPYTDLEINCRSQLSLLEACRRNNPAVKVVFAGHAAGLRPRRLAAGHRSRTWCGRPTSTASTRPPASTYHLVYNNVFGVRACSLRLTNVYGPRQLLKHNRQGFIGWFIRLAIEDREIQIYGDGSQLRDFVYVDDAADAFLRAGASDAANGQVFNVGGDRADHAPRPRRAADRDRRLGPLPLRRVAAREEGDRHRRLLRRLVAHRAHARLAAGDAAARRAAARRSTFYRAHLDALRCRAAAQVGASVSAPRPHPVHRPAARRGRRRGARRRSIACIARGWFVLGPEVEAFEAEFAAACGARARRRRRQRHRRDRAAAARGRHRRRATK